MKEPLLYLCHRIPFPPNKGDKITTCNVLKFLSRHFDVYLGCFIDDQFDQRYVSDVQALCADTLFIPLNPSVAKVKGLRAFLTGDPITVPYYSHQKMQRWVNKVITTHGIEKAFVYSGCMAQYLLAPPKPIHKVIDFADIDSDKWRQYAHQTKGIMRYVYQREHTRLENFEKSVADNFDISCFISETEADQFKTMVSTPTKSKIQILENGIDCFYFSPDQPSKLSEPYVLEEQNYIVFTGAMDYRPNIDAVLWFVNNVWPQVLISHPDSYFYIVGSTPPKAVLSLAQQPGVVVTGRVEDIRPYMQHAKAAIAPMRMARGIQNKILEAMAMAKPVLSSSIGMEGLENYPTQYLSVEDSPEDIATWIIEKLAHPALVATESRQWLEANFSWDAKLTPLLSYLGASHE
ncbi:TIGR03087 family PEP-CTERM/XrtA system glycosyltransferase [Photobacterium kagoshimensis]|uniref:TIGR03087 family PEP-CTERM/XrtA system glycosyltransferase n=1 Tax=Photobacterium kagoshimensis TaxID=2910242 RepID=UPI003D14C1CB